MKILICQASKRGKAAPTKKRKRCRLGGSGREGGEGGFLTL